ncbi:hypothetical protein PMSM_25900 [Paenibacillus macquariensis subsp. macquariensis]|nr:hypothetical protein PMSM_25900 [Paenibacillus macquariensis subsp. macquariensis]
MNHSECAGAPILKGLWDRIDFSLLLTQSGIMKRSGTPSWLVCFLYVVGIYTRWSFHNWNYSGNEARGKLMSEVWIHAMHGVPWTPKKMKAEK